MQVRCREATLRVGHLKRGRTSCMLVAVGLCVRVRVRPGPYDGEGLELVAEIADLEGKRVVGAHLVVVLELDGVGEVRQRELVLAGAVAVDQDELTTGL